MKKNVWVESITWLPSITRIIMSIENISDLWIIKLLKIKWWKV